MKKTKKPSVGIIGAGFIGQVLKQYYPQAKVFDIRPGNWDDPSEVLKQKYVFIAINVKDNAIGFTSKKAIEFYLNQVSKDTCVIIKSTLVPGTTDYFQEKYNDIPIVYNPEFLTESTAWIDFTKPQFQILGVTSVSAHLEKELFSLLPKAPIKKVISAREAEVFKHAINSFFATKVIFFNELYDACMELGADYENVRELIVKHPWIGDSHTVVWHKGYRGFGGKCLPKDTRALHAITHSRLLEAVLMLNEELHTRSKDALQVKQNIPANQ